MPPIETAARRVVPGHKWSPSAGGGQREYYGFAGSQTWIPPVNLYETEAAYVVCVDLAGVQKEKIDIEVDGRRLTLRGTRAVPNSLEETREEPHRVRVHLMEIDHGPFVRDVELPADSDRQAITASYRDGFLWIQIPRDR